MSKLMKSKTKSYFGISIKELLTHQAVESIYREDWEELFKIEKELKKLNKTSWWRKLLLWL